MSLPGGWEIVVIALIIIFLFNGNKVKESMKNLGKGFYKAKKEVDEIKDLTNKS